ncbi:MAG: 16S rRNA (guanine(966)-N(2))-methyltransferase RsmD [Alkalibacterium sp.]|nr:16S rRNA (guanine(966)-N(2))-methyltransferase RsmD [Alkalibacterium sp.]TVP92452.1 MAG: 16S rRNA (guanine(966)-N(2))-methyltransferase RsmD [Alkalibacterium sp.]
MRVISGEYGGRPLKSVKGNSTRPTTDKIKESLFQVIGPYFDGGKALDLFAGSGALGIEAVSRGMDEAYLIDMNPQAIAVIRENIKMTKEESKFTVMKSKDKSAISQLSSKEIKFDLVFLDPPYADQGITSVMQDLIKNDLLNDGAIIVCETDKFSEVISDNPQLILFKEKIYGQTKLSLFERTLQDV